MTYAGDKGLTNAGMRAKNAARAISTSEWVLTRGGYAPATPEQTLRSLKNARWELDEAIRLLEQATGA